MSKDEYLITDPPLKALTVFAMPMILGSFFQQVYNNENNCINIIDQLFDSKHTSGCVRFRLFPFNDVFITNSCRYTEGSSTVSACLFCWISVSVYVQHFINNVYLDR